MMTKNFFQNLPSLEFIDLSNSNLTKVADLTFSIPSLVRISLRANLLRSLSGQIFTGANSLETIDLSWNLLSFIAPETFLLLSLKSLDLSRNKIHNKTFHESEADWTDEIPSLKILDLSFNSIVHSDSMPYETFSGLVNLESLNLRGNQVSFDYGVLATNKHLKLLDISYNIMTYFDLNFLLSIRNLETLYAHGNGLSYEDQIDVKGIRSIHPNFKYIGISDNSFTCEILSGIVKNFLREKLELVIENGKFVNNKRNILGIECS